MRLRPRGLNNGQLRVVERTSEGGEVGGGVLSAHSTSIMMG